MVLALAGVAILTAAFVATAVLMASGASLRFDERILLAFRVPDNPGLPIGPPWLREGMRDLTSMGSVPVLGLLVAGVVVFLWLSDRRQVAVQVLAAVLGGLAISTAFKIGFDRPRPELTGVARVFTASFPSGHAMLSSIIYLTLGVMLAQAQPKRVVRIYLVLAAVVLPLLIGVTRVYLGVHYPTDVLAGWFAGAAWALLCLVALAWRRRSHRA